MSLSSDEAPQPGQLLIGISHDEGRVVLSLSGELDLVTVPHLLAELSRAEVARAERLVIDLRSVQFMDSSGLHALLKARERCAQNGCRLLLRRGTAQVDRLFGLTGVLEMFSFEEDPRTNGAPWSARRPGGARRRDRALGRG